MLKDKKNEVWNIVEIARNKERPNVRFYIENIFDDFIEFHGDRNFRDDKAVIGGIASIDKISVTVIGVNKGKNLKENVDTNFGMVHPEGYRKALRLTKQAEKFNRPIICFVNTTLKRRKTRRSVSTEMRKLRFCFFYWGLYWLFQ